jgi:hypothetical protein
MPAAVKSSSSYGRLLGSLIDSNPAFIWPKGTELITLHAIFFAIILPTTIMITYLGVKIKKITFNLLKCES